MGMLLLKSAAPAGHQAGRGRACTVWSHCASCRMPQSSQTHIAMAVLLAAALAARVPHNDSSMSMGDGSCPVSSHCASCRVQH